MCVSFSRLCDAVVQVHCKYDCIPFVKKKYDGEESTKTFTPINRLFTGLNELLENATRDEKEDQIDEKYFLMKSTASNVELLSRHLSISLTTNDSEDS